MRKLVGAIVRLFILPGDFISDRLGVSQEENRGLVRMQINSLFWAFVAILGLAAWTSRLPLYQ